MKRQLTIWSNCPKRIDSLEEAVKFVKANESKLRIFAKEDDNIGEKFFKEPITDGIHKGDILDRKKFEQMKDKFYTLRGYDLKTGVPTRKRLEELKLKFVADELEII